MEKKAGILIIAVLMLLLILPLANSLYMGTVKGYALDGMGAIQPGTSISITVNGCSGQGCSASAITDANGFYIQTNLNILPSQTITVTATSGNAYGTSTGTAVGSGSVGVATINITMCTAPQQPSLNPVADTHSNSIISMSWTTYKTGAEYDIFDFDSVQNTSAESPQIKTNLAYSSHTWRVKTCNSQCCSAYAGDTFNVYNNLPPLPVLAHQGDTNVNNIYLNWSGGVDPDSDMVSFEFRIDGNTTPNAASPFYVQNLAYGHHAWSVRACDNIGCTAWVQDSFNIVNNPPAAPTLTDQGYVSTTLLHFNWTSYPDPEGSPTHDEFQISTDPSFSAITQQDLDANSPKTLGNFSTITLYYWRVRTCDLQNACSAYSTDTYFIYPSAGNYTEETYIYGTRTKTINKTCTPRWECGNWNACSPQGISTRNCFDANNCIGAVPMTSQLCSISTLPQLEKPSPVVNVNYIDTFVTNGEHSATMHINETWVFAYQGKVHTFKITEINGKNVLLQVASPNPQEIEIPLNESTFLDVDEDGDKDIEVRIVEKNHVNATLVFKTHSELLEEPLQTISRSNLLIPLLILIIVLLSYTIGYQYNKYVSREIKVDRSLRSYISSALEKGFTEQQVRSKLLENGFAKEEISFVFNELGRKRKSKT